jgi:hypothetical protein
MPDLRAFDYDAALRRLIELRYSARDDDPAASDRLHEEERRLERDIYKFVLGTSVAERRPREAQGAVKDH